ncbi:MAG: trypsin-like peptidase domain-containing protein, partial [Microthrixaceae bacterium]|nr:trypsin-like peptidase domain-containing protein [Microthrixaceae bacterium]
MPSAPETRPGKGRNWWGALVLGALIGAIVASIVSGAIYTASVRTSDSATSGSTSNPGGNTSLDRAPTPTIVGEPLDIGSILDKARPSIVSIRIESSSVEASGSGIVIDDAGTVLTNAHVISGTDGLSSAITVQFHDGASVPAQLVGSFPDQDVAIVRTVEPHQSTPAELGSSEALTVGEDVIAIGNALNLGAQPSVTRGIVSALNRTLTAESVVLENLIQTDA